MKLLQRIFNIKSRFSNEVLHIVIGSTGKYRIIKTPSNRTYPQKEIDCEWVNILCTNELGWYRVPRFSGYSDYENAKINIECCLKYGNREAVEYYR